MSNNKITLREAVNFHGHLGPYLVLGILAGNLAMEKLAPKKYFGLNVKTWGLNKKPKSCLIDGLQLSTGATYGKGNIQKLNGGMIKILFRDLKSKRKLKVCLKGDLAKKLKGLKDHASCEKFARQLYKIGPLNLFKLTTYGL